MKSTVTHPLFPALSLALGLLARSGAALDNSDCLSCHEDKSLTKTGPGGAVISLHVDPAAYGNSVHASNQCIQCHTDIKEAPHPDDFKARPATCNPCHDQDAATYAHSTHGEAVRSGNPKAPRCADCHGTHAITRLSLPASPLNSRTLPETCGKCHPQELKDLRDSAHGKAMAQGVREAPICTDCHSGHEIAPLSKASPMKISEKVCSQCHASERINARYSLPANRTSSFMDSYHGLAARLGSTSAANCASCHGYHKILPSSDPESMIHPSNMVKTCGKCHPGANANFSLGRIHGDGAAGQDIGSVINRWVRWIYLALIAAVIGGMLVHNLLTFRRKLIIAYGKKDHSVIRMNLIQRIQHGLLLVSFISLSVTGFALKYPDGWLAWLVGSSEAVRRTGHRVAAIVMIAVALFHVAYLLWTRDGRKLLKDLLPRLQDVVDVFANLKYLLVPGAAKPKFARFSYGEKAEYWAVVWGTVIMGLTGAVIWFKMEASQWMPRWVIEVSTTIHFYEAILAVLAIIVWHFYHVIFDPDVYPNNTAWLNGRVSKEWYHEEHELDTESLPHDAAHVPKKDPEP